MKNHRSLSRRGFLQKTTLAAAPLILPSHVLGAFGSRTLPGPNERISIGMIGVGGMGRGHLARLRDHVVAICDVDQDHLNRAVQSMGRPVAAHTDYRRVLEQQDIDAVVIASPDHWHALMTIQACEAGKDVYVEKPTSNTVREGQAMIKAMKRYARVVQVGAQGRSMDSARSVYNYLRNGGIGRVHRVECWHYENPVGGDPHKNGPAPDTLDWDMWLGPAREVPYNPDRVHFNFRWFLDFGGGNIRDRGAHVLNLVSWFLDLDHTGPVRVTAEGDRPPVGLYDCPTRMKATWEFEDPELTVVWEQPGTKPVDRPFGAVFHGTDGSLVVAGGDGGGVFPDAKVFDFSPPSNGVTAPHTPEHMANFLECVHTRETPIMDLESAHRACVMCILGNLSYRLNRPLNWDPVNEVFIGDEQANRMLSEPVRGDWSM